jgi:hypothetical protein
VGGRSGRTDDDREDRLQATVIGAEQADRRRVESELQPAAAGGIENR